MIGSQTELARLIASAKGNASLPKDLEGCAHPNLTAFVMCFVALAYESWTRHDYAF